MLRAMRALRDKLSDLWRARELLRQLVNKELKVRYKNSALGFLWSLLTPAAMTVVFTVVFQFVFRLGIKDFAAFFLAGYLAWMFFSNSVQGSIQAIVGNGNLIKKVYFPREVLPLSIVLAQLIHLLLALLAVSPYFIWTRGWGILSHLPALAIGIVLLTIFTSGFSMLLAGANVQFRDLQELIVVVFLIWFYATPIIYPPSLLDEQPSFVQTIILDLNPMAIFVDSYRDVLYHLRMPTGMQWLAMTAVALVTLAIGVSTFRRFEPKLAEEL